MIQQTTIRTDLREIIHRFRNRKQTEDQVAWCASLFADQLELLLADRDRPERELAAANLDNARKTYEINRLVGERAAERQRADAAEAALAEERALFESFRHNSSRADEIDAAEGL